MHLLTGKVPMQTQQLNPPFPYLLKLTTLSRILTFRVCLSCTPSLGTVNMTTMALNHCTCFFLPPLFIPLVMIFKRKRKTKPHFDKVNLLTGKFLLPHCNPYPTEPLNNAKLTTQQVHLNKTLSWPTVQTFKSKCFAIQNLTNFVILNTNCKVTYFWEWILNKVNHITHKSAVWYKS